MSVEVDFRKCGFTGPIKVKDIWQAKDLGAMNSTYTVKVPSHGVVLLRVVPGK